MARGRLVLVVALAACGYPPPPLATPADAARAGVELAALQRGRDLLVRKCSGCHAPPLPRAKPPREWPAIVDDMVERSGVDPDQRGLIVQYLVTLAAATDPPASAP